MRFRTQPCWSETAARSSLMKDQVTLIGPDAPSSLQISGSRAERIALLTKWAEVEGCTVTVGVANSDRRESVATVYGSSDRLGD